MAGHRPAHANPMTLTVVVPFRNGQATLPGLLASVPANVPVIVVDDQSDTPLTWPAANVTVIRPTTRKYFTGAVNVGVAAAAADSDILIVNQDVVFDNFAAFRAWITRYKANYALMGERIEGSHPAWPMGYIHGTCLFIRRDAWEAVGPMDAKNFPLWGSTADWQCRAMRKGYRALATTQVPGFRHLRKGTLGPSIRKALSDEPERRAEFLRTPPLISVVIDCFNYGRFLTDAVNSLIGGPTFMGDMPGQTLQAFEIIIVDDASTDETPEIGRSLANPWQGIRYMRLEPSRHADGMPNHGTPAARNAGILAAHGRYIAILCADDMMEPERLERMYAAALANPHSIIYDDLIEVRKGRRDRVLTLREYDFEELLDKNHVHAGIMFPKAAWEEVGGYPEVMRYGREDWAFNVALGAAGWCGIKLDTPGYLYRRADHNRTNRNRGGEWRERFVAQMQGIFPALYAGERTMACCGKGKQPGGAPARRGPGVAGAAAPGMVLLEYVGLRSGDFPVTGPATRQVYRFGGNHRQGFVDERDLHGTRQIPGLLERYDGPRLMFKRAADAAGPQAGALVLKPDEARRINLPPAAPITPVFVVPDAPLTDMPTEPAPDSAEPVLVAPAEPPAPRRRARRKKAVSGEAVDEE